MPPARRGRPPGSSSSSSHNHKNNPRAAQQTLAFGRTNKITKSSLPPPPSRQKVSKSKNDDLVTPSPATTPTIVTEAENVKPENTEIVNADTASMAEESEETVGIPIRESKREDALAEKKKKGDADGMEEKARRVTDAAVKRYWRDREAERKAPR
ncbi:MAG: hypothetical protein Q9200_003523, partial [Gallowayella weberi]